MLRARPKAVSVTVNGAAASNKYNGMARMTIEHDQIQRVYANYAGVYDRVFGRVFQDSREAVVRNLKVGPGERVLEVGVGTGLCLPLYPVNCDITAIDLSEPMLEKA